GMRTRSQSRNFNRQQQQVPPTFVEPFNLVEPIENQEDSHAHICYFNKITSTMKFPNVPSTSVKLMLPKFSIHGADRLLLNQGPIYQPQVNQPPTYQAPVYQAPAPQTQGNTITNPKEDLKGITTRSGVAYQGPAIHSTSSSPPKVKNRDTEVTKDTMLPTNNGSTEDVQPPVVQVQSQNPTSEPVVDPVSAPMPNQQTSIPFPSRRNDERRREKANDQIEKFYEIFRDLSFKISFTDALTLMPKFASTLKTLIGNKEKLSEMARTPLNENCSAVILNKLPKKLGDPGRFLIPYLADRSITEPIGIAKDVRLMVGKFQFPADFVMFYEGEITLLLAKRPSHSKSGPTSRYNELIQSYDGKPESTIIELASEEYSHEVPVFLIHWHTDFPLLHLEEVNAFIAIDDEPISREIDATYYDPEGDDKLPVIIAKDLKDEEKAALIKVLKSHKRAIAWKLSDIKGVDPEFCTHKILMEEDYEPIVQS
ncbi:hypothetical protein Tco_0936661, partial [Tanacetum coccineum]